MPRRAARVRLRRTGRSAFPMRTSATTGTPERRARPRWIATCGGVALALAAATACAPLVQVRPLEGSFSAEPLPPQELRTRFQTRLYAAEFADRIELVADRIAASSEVPAVRAAALRWKLGASSAAMRAGLRQPGQLALVDTWTLARQAAALVDGGGAGTAFGERQGDAVEAARALERDADALAERLLAPQALDAYRALVDGHARRHPIADLGFSRAPIGAPWLAVAQRVDGVPRTLGAASEVIADAADRSDAYARRVPDWLRWRAEGLMQDSASSVAGFGRSVESIDRELAGLAALAREQPERAQVALERLRTDVATVLAATDRRWLEAFATLRAERIAVGHALEESRIVLDATIERERAALSAAFDAQREKLTESFDRQRAAMTADAERISTQLSRLWLDGARSVLRDALLGLGLFLLGIAGAGFGLGWALARSRLARLSPSPRPAGSSASPADPDRSATRSGPPADR
jgi:hypothetical protein